MSFSSDASSFLEAVAGAGLPVASGKGVSALASIVLVAFGAVAVPGSWYTWPVEACHFLMLSAVVRACEMAEEIIIYI